MQFARVLRRRSWRGGIGVALALAVVITGHAAATTADSTPVGPLPPGPVTSVKLKRGGFVAVAMPQQKPSGGLGWRLARRIDSRALRQVSEADAGPAVVVMFEAVGPGRASVDFALTRGESSGRAVRAVRYRVNVT